MLCGHLRVTPEMEVLDIGTGTGIQALTALERGAERVVATDINPAAAANARYNADRRGWGDRLDVRLVSPDAPGAYAVIGPEERFDLIVSNPPFFDGTVRSPLEYAGLDEGHQLLRSILGGLRDHLKPGGSAMLCFWAPGGLELLERLAGQHALRLTVVHRGPWLVVPPAEASRPGVPRAASAGPALEAWMARRAGHDVMERGAQLIIVQLAPSAEGGREGSWPS
jgi:methylase of polypeptide subunit release factors